jgi:hypothetical protein
MKIDSAKYLLIVAWILLFILSDCKKEAAKVVPTVTIDEVTTVTGTTATIKTGITSDGGAAVEAGGVCWSSTNPMPTLWDSRTADNVGSESFISSITGLIPGTTYYIRAYAVNASGIGYSSRSTFKTLVVEPAVTTMAITAVTSATAGAGGSVTYNGGGDITARGVCWSTSQNPTIADNKTTDGTGTGSFTSAITGLTAGTPYYVRAYAINSTGTGYGNEISFVINDYLPLTIGAKYKYNYSEFYSYGSFERSQKRGECTWKFISISAGTPVVYQVEQSFNGYTVYPGHIDSIKTENQISNLSFEVLNDGKVAFTFSVPYWGACNVTFERFIQSDRIDTCFMFSPIKYGCLRKNVGIIKFSYDVWANHQSGVEYTLIEGPYY